MTGGADSASSLLDDVACRVIVAGRQTMPAGWSLATRVLAFHDVIFVEKGKGVIRRGLREQRVQAPAWVILPAGVEHAIEGMGLRLAVVHVETRLGGKLDALRVFWTEETPSLEPPAAALAAFQSAIDAWQEATPVGRICANRSMEMWFARAFSGRSAAVPADARLVAALAWFQKNSHRRVRLEDVARHVGVSTPHLRSLFSQRLGISPKRALQDLRLARAKEALEHGGAGVAEAAYGAGWEDVSGFSRSFRSHFGVSPGEYRRQLTTRSTKNK